MNYVGGTLSLKEIKEGIKDLHHMLLQIKQDTDRRLKKIEEYLQIVEDDED